MAPEAPADNQQRTYYQPQGTVYPPQNDPYGYQQQTTGSLFDEKVTDSYGQQSYAEDNNSQTFIFLNLVPQTQN